MFYTQEEIFGSAVWVGNEAGSFSLLRASFRLSEKPDSAVLHVLGLGCFHCYINGREITGNAFQVLSTDYEPRPDYPTGERLAGHRVYVPRWDVAEYLREGENVLALHYGGGWYTFEDAKFGAAKAIFRLNVKSGGREIHFDSSPETARVRAGFVSGYYFPQYEHQDYLNWDDAWTSPGYDDSAWVPASPALPLRTRYAFSDCPADRITETLPVRVLRRDGDTVLYDCGRNTAGFPQLRLRAARGEKISLTFTEALLPDGTPDPKHSYHQAFTVISDGRERTVSPAFTWFGFRYFTLTGAAEAAGVSVVHSDIAVTSSFESGHPALDWLYRAYLDTQLANMHMGIPSDCPHIERRGYTGDGELTCHAAMTLTDARAFYRKWIGDIGDCQDTLTGHVQYTAPYTRCGGGPGAWGCAIAEVPYQYYRHYGDIGPADELYPQMLRYFDYLDAHSQNGLVVSDKKGEWCLGDWCAPGRVILPAPFVNNYYYVKTLNRVIEIARRTGREKDIPMLEARREERKRAMTAAYFNTWDGTFLGCTQGANAFAVDIGIGDERTYPALVSHYRELGHFDTGICGTEVVSRVLFEHGDGDVAAALLMSEDRLSFDAMRRAGATTLWEYWPGEYSRSLDHPMFGAVAAHLSDYLLGIRQEEGKAGFTDIVIAPCFIGALPELRGSRGLPAGQVTVSYHREGNAVRARIGLPEGVNAVFRYKETVLPLRTGDNAFTVKL